MASATSNSMEKVLVTGATGYLATHIIQQLLEQGKYRVRTVCLDSLGGFHFLPCLLGEAKVIGVV